MTPEKNLLSLGLTLPSAPPPVASYVPWRCLDKMVYVSGQLPMKEGRLACTGKVGSDLTTEQGAEGARLAALNGLAQLAAAAKGLDNIEEIIRVGVFVNSAPGFVEQAKVANGASDLMVAVFEEAGRHARAAVGVSELPLDAAVEVELLARMA